MQEVNLGSGSWEEHLKRKSKRIGQREKTSSEGFSREC